MRLKTLFIFTLLIGVVLFASATKNFAQNSSDSSRGNSGSGSGTGSYNSSGSYGTSSSSSGSSSGSSTSQTGGMTSSRSLGGSSSRNSSSSASSFSLDTNAVQAVRNMSALSDTNSSGFVGGGTSDFIGGSSSGGGSRSSSSSSMRRSSSLLSSSRNRNGQTGMYGNMGNRGMNSQTQLQPAYTLGFTPAPTDYQIVTTALSTRINRVNNIGRLGDIQVNMAEGVAVLRGDVKTEHDRKVAENMARLQPGVKSVRSEINVSAARTVQTE